MWCSVQGLHSHRICSRHLPPFALPFCFTKQGGRALVKLAWTYKRLLFVLSMLQDIMKSSLRGLNISKVPLSTKIMNRRSAAEIHWSSQLFRTQTSCWYIVFSRLSHCTVRDLQNWTSGWDKGPLLVTLVNAKCTRFGCKLTERIPAVWTGHQYPNWAIYFDYHKSKLPVHCFQEGFPWPSSKFIMFRALSTQMTQKSRLKKITMEDIPVYSGSGISFRPIHSSQGQECRRYCPSSYI